MGQYKRKKEGSEGSKQRSNIQEGVSGGGVQSLHSRHVASFAQEATEYLSLVRYTRQYLKIFIMNVGEVWRGGSEREGVTRVDRWT